MGKPILAYTIEAAQKSGLFDYIVVSTDSFQTMDIAQEYGAIPKYRPSNLADDETPVIEVVKHVNQGYDADTVVLLYATGLPDAEVLKKAFNEFEGDKRPLLSVTSGEDAGMFCFYARGNVVAEDFRFYEVEGIDINTPEDWDRALHLRRTKND